MYIKGRRAITQWGVHHSNSSKLFQVYPKYHWNKGDFLAQAPLSSGRFLFTLQNRKVGRWSCWCLFWCVHRRDGNNRRMYQTNDWMMLMVIDEFY